MQRKRVGVNPLIETQTESNLLVDRQKRYLQIVEILEDINQPMTAREIAIEMKKRGFSNRSERNLSAPRINEMLNKGILDCVGTKKDNLTNRTVGVFELRKEN